MANKTLRNKLHIHTVYGGYEVFLLFTFEFPNNLSSYTKTGESVCSFNFETTD